MASNNTNWWEVLGNAVTASEVIAKYNATHTAGETLADWIFRQSEEIWGDEHDSGVNFVMLADQVRNDAQVEQKRA